MSTVNVDANYWDVPVNVDVIVPLLLLLMLLWILNGSDGCVKMPPNEFRNKEKVSKGCSRDRKE